LPRLSCRRRPVGRISRKRSNCPPEKYTFLHSITIGTMETSRRRTTQHCTSGHLSSWPTAKPFGILVINIDMRPAFERVRSSPRKGEAMYAVNAHGDYLVHPDPQPPVDANWQKDFPDLAASLGSTKAIARTFTDQTGRPGGLALAPALLAGKEWVGIIEACRTPSSWSRRRRSRTPPCWSG